MIYCIFFGGSVLQHVEAVTLLAVEVALTTLRNSPERISDGDSDFKNRLLAEHTQVNTFEHSLATGYTQVSQMASLVNSDVVSSLVSFDKCLRLESWHYEILAAMSIVAFRQSFNKFFLMICCSQFRHKQRSTD